MGVFTGLRTMARKHYPRTLILLYHRVAIKHPDMQQLCVAPERFAEHMAILRSDYNPVPFSQISQWDFSKNAVVVTFDDGYVDNLLWAKPILERFDIPATIFVTTGYVVDQRPFWWDELEYYLSNVESDRTEDLNLIIGGHVHLWPLDNASQRQQAYHDLMQILTGVDADEVERVVKQMREHRTMSDHLIENGYRAFTVNELRELAACDLIEIGAHTRNHVNLAVLTPSAQLEEIQGCRQDLETWLGRECVSFSYPFGFPNLHFDKESVEIVRQCGYRRACSNHTGWTTWRTNPLRYPRYLVRDWDGEKFQRQLMQWFANPPA